MRTLPLSFFVVSFLACGPASTPAPKQGVGGGCIDSLDCSSGSFGSSLMCDDTMIHGYCTKSCERTANCPDDSMCIAVGSAGMCAAECDAPGGQSTCRDSYTCYAVTNSSKGVCFPDGFDFGTQPPPQPPPAPKSPVGAACSAASQCAAGSCFDPAHGWPAGYCSAGCTSSNSCGSDAICLSNTNSCVALCPSPGVQSTCRDGYVCRGLLNRTDGFCTPAPKSPTGASCASGATCGDGTCMTAWPNGYCSRTCNFGSDCNSGVCLDDSRAGQKYCVATCPSPGAQSTCRDGYTCSPFAAPRTDGFCEPSGGGGGGTPPPKPVNYKVVSISGNWSGNAINAVTSSRTDTLAMNTCTFTNHSESANSLGFLGIGDWTKFSSMEGTSSCPATQATSTSTGSCAVQLFSTTSAKLEWSVEMSGSADDDLVTFKLLHPPAGLPGCNYANVIVAGTYQWGMQASTTVGKFRAGMPFSLRFNGARLLTQNSTTSDVSWDFTMTIQPY